MIYTFHSPKTAGNTITCLNAAILYQITHPDVRVGLIQLTRYPDLHLYQGSKVPSQTCAELKKFIETKEWSPKLLTPLTATKVIDYLPSPKEAEWDQLTKSEWSAIHKLIEDQYPVIFFDLGRDIPQDIIQNILEASDHCVAVSCLDPSSLAALDTLRESHPQTRVIFNQVPRGAKLPNIKALGLLPHEANSMWEQVYTQFPVVLQKRSRWKKALQKSLKYLYA